jgi:CRISPR-associated protein Csx14
MMMNFEPKTLIATMAGGPQIVTFALDSLLAQGENIREVVIVHLSPADDPLTDKALQKLASEFAGSTYAGRYPCRLFFHPVLTEGRKLDDIRDETAANIAWSSIYTLIADMKAQNRHLHVCISGGRRMLALLAMSAAMLHFDHTDRLWHMYTPRSFLERAGNGTVMHARPEDGVRLIRVPLAPWGAYFPGLRALTQLPPLEAVAAQTRQLDGDARRRCQAVVDTLTPRQLDTLRAFAAGQSPQEAAETLCVTVKTVHAHKTEILGACRNVWELPDDERLTYHFLREKFGAYFENE